MTQPQPQTNQRTRSMPKDYEMRPGETFEQWFCRLNHCSHPRHCDVCAEVSR